MCVPDVSFVYKTFNSDAGIKNKFKSQNRDDRL